MDYNHQQTGIEKVQKAWNNDTLHLISPPGLVKECLENVHLSTANIVGRKSQHQSRFEGRIRVKVSMMIAKEMRCHVHCHGYDTDDFENGEPEYFTIKEMSLSKGQWRRSSRMPTSAST
jgi:hypothetical protein